MRARSNSVALLLIGLSLIALAAMLSPPTSAEDVPPAAGCENLSWLYFWHPNETKVERFYVMNQGTIVDSYDLELVISEESWEGSLDRYELLYVEPGERRHFNLTIRAPALARAGEYTNVTLTAYSRGAPINASLSWRCFVIVEREVRLSCDDWEREIETPGTVEFHLSVTNTGDLDDNYTIFCTVAVGGDTWNVTSDLRSVELEVDGTAPLVVSARPLTGLEELEELSVLVRAQSDSDGSVWSTRRLQVTIAPFLEASVHPGNETWELSPGSTVSLDTTLVQVTNRGRWVNWSARLDDVSAGLNASLMRNDTILQGPKSTNITLMVTAPGQAHPGIKMSLVLIVTCVDEPRLRFEVRKDFVVRLVRSVHVLAELDGRAIPPGTDHTVYVTVENRGNAQEQVEVHLEVPEPWDILGLPLETSPQHLQVNPFSEACCTLELGVGRTWPPGSFTIDVRCLAFDLENLTVPINLHVLEHREVALETPGREEIVMDPNAEPVDLAYSVVNLGNVEERVNIEPQVQPGGMPPYVEVRAPSELENVYVPPGGSIDLYLAVHPGTEWRPLDGRLQVRVELWNGSLVGLDVVGLVMAAPDLEVSWIVQPGPTTRGSRTSGTLLVVNNGSTDSPPSELRLEVQGGTGEVHGYPVPSLVRGESTTIEVEFNATGDLVSATIDPADEVVEEDEGDNTARHVMRMEEPDDHGGIEAVTMAYVAVGLLVLVIVTVVPWVVLRLREEPLE